jgi:hypothetical protein
LQAAFSCGGILTWWFRKGCDVAVTQSDGVIAVEKNMLLHILVSTGLLSPPLGEVNCLWDQ